LKKVGVAAAENLGIPDLSQFILALANKIRYNATSTSPPRRTEGRFFDNMQFMKRANASSLFGVFTKE